MFALPPGALCWGSVRRPWDWLAHSRLTQCCAGLGLKCCSFLWYKRCGVLRRKLSSHSCLMLLAGEMFWSVVFSLYTHRHK